MFRSLLWRNQHEYAARYFNGMVSIP